MYVYRLPFLLGSLILLNLIGSLALFVLPLEHTVVLPKISTYSEPTISPTAAFVLLDDEGEVLEERGTTLRGLPPFVWGLLLFAATALLLFNWFFPGRNRLAMPSMASRFEAFLTLSFLLLWWYWDEGHTALWFPWSLFQSALLSFAFFLSIRRERTLFEA